MEDNMIYPLESDLDLSFTSCASSRSSLERSLSSRSSLTRSSLTLSFNERVSISNSTNVNIPMPNLNRKHDRTWSAIKAATTLSIDNTLHLRHLKLLRLVGSGNIGRVFLCKLRDYDHSQFALKVVDRDSLTSKKLEHVQTESEILSELDHPFLPTLYAHIQVSHYTCLLMDYCSNGDLHSLLRKQPLYRLPVEAVRFYAAEVLVALEYLHSLGIVYRDLKPENILIREDGHIMLSDFDLCFRAEMFPTLDHHTRTTDRGREETVTEFVAEPTTAFSRSCVGTHEYLAPELVGGNGHGNGVDWWAFGILIHELLFGTTPFKGGSKESTLRNIASSKGLSYDVDLMERGQDIWIDEARDLIEKLLVKDPKRRLGTIRGATDIKRHPFFHGIKWPLIRSYRPPEVRGLVVKRCKSSRVTTAALMPRRRRCWWKRVAHLFRIKGSKYTSLGCNHNYYCSVNKFRK